MSFFDNLSTQTSEAHEWLLVPSPMSQLRMTDPNIDASQTNERMVTRWLVSTPLRFAMSTPGIRSW
jgi:hypothetical protein